MHRALAEHLFVEDAIVLTDQHDGARQVVPGDGRVDDDADPRDPRRGEDVAAILRRDKRRQQG